MGFFQSGRMQRATPLLDLLVEAARESALATRRYIFTKEVKHRNATLRPGCLTPLWNELVIAANHHLRRRGEKAILARELGISRQRLHVVLKAKTATLDAERTLQLVAWVLARQRASRSGNPKPRSTSCPPRLEENDPTSGTTSCHPIDDNPAAESTC